MTTQPGPAVRRRQLARSLKDLRLAAKLTLKRASDRSGLSDATISRIENAKQVILPRTVRLLCQAYGVGQPTLAHLVQQAEESEERGWHLAYSDTVPDWFDRYAGEEHDAAGIATYEAEFVPGLFQTDDYCRAIKSAADPDVSEEELVRAVEFRKARQERLFGDDPPRVSAVLNEAVLHRVVGNQAVMRDQLTHLAALADHPHLDVRVLPFSAGAHPAMVGSFAMLRFPGDRDWSTVFVEVQQGALYPDRPNDLDRYTWVWEELARLALPAADSRDLLSRLAS